MQDQPTSSFKFQSDATSIDSSYTIYATSYIEENYHVGNYFQSDYKTRRPSPLFLT